MQREHLGARAARSNEAGFTLIELMMVIFIIAILIAVLTPVFLGATTRAKDRAMQTSLVSALKAARSVAADGDDYTQATVAQLTNEAHELKFVGSSTPPSGQTTVSVAPISAGYIVFGGLSKSGDCFYLADDTLGTGTLKAKMAGAGGCSADGAPLPGDALWKKDW
jgi:prepilin-type N-terminal cleavage/methylation domain-containing protein